MPDTNTAPSITWSSLRFGRLEEYTDGTDEQGNTWIWMEGRAQLLVSAESHAAGAEADRLQDTLYDPDVCREAIRRYRAARGVAAQVAVLAAYGLQLESDLAKWKRRHVQNGETDMS